MKLLTTLAICLSTGFSLFAQSHVIYLKPDGAKTTNADSANSYIMYQFNPADSLWFMQQFGMDHLVMTTGYYADEAMSVPHGKFTYYQSYPARQLVKYDFIKREYDTTKFDAANVVSSTGYYLNGKRNGKWQVYNEYGVLREIFFYRDDKQSGPVRYFADDGKRTTEEGFLKDGFKDGNWSFYSPKGALLGTMRYYRGDRQGISSNLDSKTLSVRRGMPDYDLTNYLSGALRMRKLKRKRNCSLSYFFQLGKDGKLTKPEIMDSGCDIDLEVAIGEIMMGAPAWDTPVKSRQPTDATAVVFLKVYFDADNLAHVAYHTSNPGDNILLFSPEF